MRSIDFTRPINDREMFKEIKEIAARKDIEFRRQAQKIGNIQLYEFVSKKTKSVLLRNCKIDYAYTLAIKHYKNFNLINIATVATTAAAAIENYMVK